MEDLPILPTNQGLKARFHNRKPSRIHAKNCSFFSLNVLILAKAFKGELLFLVDFRKSFRLK